MKNIEITKENREMYEELYRTKWKQENGEDFFSEWNIGILVYDWCIAILTVIGVGIVCAMESMCSLANYPKLLSTAASLSTGGGYVILCLVGIKKLNKIVKEKD